MTKRARSPTPVLNTQLPIEHRLPVLPTRRHKRIRIRTFCNAATQTNPLTYHALQMEKQVADIYRRAMAFVAANTPIPIIDLTIEPEPKRETRFTDLPVELRLMIFTIAANTAKAKWFRRKRRAMLSNLEMPEWWGMTPAGNTDIYLTKHHEWRVTEHVDCLFFGHHYYVRAIDFEPGLPSGVNLWTEAFFIPENAEIEEMDVSDDDPIQEYWIDVV